MYANVMNPTVILVRTFNIGLYEVYIYTYKYTHTQGNKREGRLGGPRYRWENNTY
jgi:hypothetical protein